MRAVGELLKAARGEQKISLAEASRATKIHQRFLQALEANDFTALPSPTSARGFLKNYAEYLGLASMSVLAAYRRDFGRQEPLQADLPDHRPFAWQPKMTLAVVLGSFFLALAGYLGYQYFSLAKPPSLAIQAPQDKQKIVEEKVEVLGQSDADAAVTVNGQPVFVTGEGEFRYKVELFSGENKIVVESQSRLGKKSQLEITVFHP